MYRAFSAMELEIIGAFIKGYQHIEVPVREVGLDQRPKIVGTKIVPFPQTTNEFDLVRPYTPLERFIEAVKFLSIAKKIRFENAIFHANNNKIEAIGQMDMKRLNESKKVYDRIIGWDEEYLNTLVEKRKNILEGQLGLKFSPAPPLTIASSISDLEQMALKADGKVEEPEEELKTLPTFSEKNEPVLSSSIPVKERPRRGRPPKDKN